MNIRFLQLPMLTLLPLSAAIAMPPQPIPEYFESAAATPSFAELDRNNDSVLSRDELPPGHELARRFSEFDLDGDQTISRAEFEAYLRGDATAGAEDDEEEEEI
jgi:hypothetical protein